MKYLNEVNVYGKVTRDPEFSHEYNGVPFYSIDLEVPRIKTSNNKKVTANIRLYFRGDQLSDDDIKTGAILAITGKLVNSKAKGLIDVSVLVEAYSVMNEYDEYMNTVTVSGEVTKVFTTPDNYKGFVNFVVAELNEEGKRVFSSRIVVWNRLADYVFNNIHIGDKVIVKGCLSNSKTKSKPSSPDEEVVPVVVTEIMGTYFSKVTDDDNVNEVVESSDHEATEGDNEAIISESHNEDDTSKDSTEETTPAES